MHLCTSARNAANHEAQRDYLSASNALHTYPKGDTIMRIDNHFSAARYGETLSCTRLAVAAAVAAITSAIPQTDLRATTGTPIAVAYCTSCATLADLAGAANSWYTVNKPPFGTQLFLTSLSEPLSALFVWYCPGLPGKPCTPHALTPSDAAAVALDNSVYARAAKIPNIILPPKYASTDEDVIIAAAIPQFLLMVGAPSTDIYRSLASVGIVAYVNVIDTQNGQTYKIYVGDTITVQYSDGSTEKFQLTSIGSTLAFKAVPGSKMGPNGQPTTPPSTKPAAPVSGGGGFSGPGTYPPNSTVGAWPNVQFCYGTVSITVADLQPSYGAFAYPC
jgi:hypothetical protein